MIRDRRVLFLAPDAYGGYGGIAAYNRDVGQALSEHPRIAETLIIPRLTQFAPAGLPDRVRQDGRSIGSIARFVRFALVEGLRFRPTLIHVGHINLSPVAALIGWLLGVPWTLSLYGTDAWDRHPSVAVRRAVRRAALLLPISQVTEERFRRSYPDVAAPSQFLPNALHRGALAMGPPRADLVERYGLGERRVVMTMSRIGVDHDLKGFARVIEALPELARDVPTVTYLICGDGPARGEVEAAARRVGVADRVVFAGYVGEGEKADHYRLADAFVMPSEGEGFGFVFIEAMACGVPVVASTTDGGYDATMQGKLGHVIDPRDRGALVAAMKAALGTARHVPAGLETFDYPHFRERLHAAIEPLL